MDAFNLSATPTAGFMSGTSLAIPTSDIVAYALDRLDELAPEHVIYAEADNPGNCILAGNVKSMVKTISLGLVTYGVGVGDCVCIHATNSIWYPLFWLATIATGAVVTGSNPAYSTHELVHHLKVTGTKFVIVERTCLSVVKDAFVQCDIPVDNIIVSPLALGIGGDCAAIDQGFTFESVVNGQLNGSACKRFKIDNEESQKDTIAVYAATSGTTGLPKAAELSHRYLVAQTANLERVFQGREPCPMRQLICLPVFHSFAAQLAIVLPLRMGITTYFMPRFDLPKYVEHVQQLCITDSAVVPPIVSALTSLQDGCLSTIRYMVCAGAPMTASVQNQLYSKLGKNANIGQCWGTTELGWISLFGPFERDMLGSVGRLLPNTTLKIVDANGNIIKNDDTPGEARIKSESMLKQYRHANTANAEAFDEEGYFCTGDIVFTRDGKLYINGRIKDTMKVNGWQVSPEEVEKVIFNLHDVADCAVVSFDVYNPKTHLEETMPRAFVVLKPGASLTELDIFRHVRDNLIGYKRLSGGVYFINAIPRSNTGKILRRKLIVNDNSLCCCDKVKPVVTGRTGLDGEVEHFVHANGYEDLRQYHGFNTLTHHCLAVVLVPLCGALGLPGLIFLALLVRLIYQS